jgi:hypothetical protein
MSNTAVDRWYELQEIHDLKDAAGLSDEQYRGLLFKLTGFLSAKNLFQNQRLEVIGCLTALMEVFNGTCVE